MYGERVQKRSHFFRGHSSAGRALRSQCPNVQWTWGRHAFDALCAAVPGRGRGGRGCERRGERESSGSPVGRMRERDYPYIWGHSSAGRALRSQRRGRGFESHWLHEEKDGLFYRPSFFSYLQMPVTHASAVRPGARSQWLHEKKLLQSLVLQTIILLEGRIILFIYFSSS